VPVGVGVVAGAVVVVEGVGGGAVCWLCAATPVSAIAEANAKAVVIVAM